MTPARHDINLLYITAGETSHYVLLKGLSRLVSRQYNNHNNKDISVKIVCTAAPVKRYWKTIWKGASYMEHKESSFQKLTTRKGMRKLNLQKQNTNCVYPLPSMWTWKAFYVKKTGVNHRHQNPSSPNTSNIYHVGATSTWNAVMENPLNHPK